MRYHQGYLAATAHPWPCFLFVLPLLMAYEVGVIWLGGAQPDALRNGADAWLRWGLETLGLNQLYCAPALIAALFFVWSWLRFWDRPDDLPSVLVGMAIESALFAVGLWGLSRVLEPAFNHLAMDPTAGRSGEEFVGRTVTFLGAGIYEEVLFRLFLFTGLIQLLRLVALLDPFAVVIAALASASLFSAAHHLGPCGESFQTSVFVFRIIAGLYFAMLYQLRGFGIAAGAHAGYDVLVGAIIT